MTVYVVMPVFNRLAATRQMVDCLFSQQTDEMLQLVIVDDGSTDDTAEFLASQPAIRVLKGDGSLWWGGAVDLAMNVILADAQHDDWLLLVNNDTRIEPSFVQSLLDIAHRHPKSAVGSVIRDEKDGRLLSVGAVIDPVRFAVRDWLDGQGGGSDKDTPGKRIFGVDALSGRGVLIPIAGLRAAGGMRPRWLPHYLADYELSLRLKSAGWQLLVTEEAAVYSEEEYGSRYRASSLWEKLTSVRSPSYLPALVMFWWEASNCAQRITLPLRAFLFAAFPSLRK